MTDEEKKERKPYVYRTLRAKQGQLIALERKQQRAKVKRFIYTVLAYAIGICYLLYLVNTFNDFLEFICAIILSIFISAILVFFNTMIFDQLHNIEKAEKKELENLKKEIDQLKRKFDYLDT